MRQQLFDATGRMRGQALQNVLEVSVGIVPIEPCRVHQAHHRSGALARTQRACEEPVVAPDGNRTDLVLDPVVVHGQAPVVDEPRECAPAFEAVNPKLLQ